MKVGTRSLLFGAHQVLVHPWFVAAAWWKLYGFPRDPRLWVAFLVHDWGYWGLRAMDDAEGERHVELGARIMARLFDPLPPRPPNTKSGYLIVNTDPRRKFWAGKWGQLCLFHSRFYAKAHRQSISRLCVADKLAIVLTPAWLYLPMARLSGEIHEYMALAKMRTVMGEPKYASMRLTTSDEARWYADVQEYLRRWVEAHKDGAEDTWTPGGPRETAGPTGVWR